jgi:hypothetical protein
LHIQGAFPAAMPREIPLSAAIPRHGAARHTCGISATIGGATPYAIKPSSNPDFSFSDKCNFHA